MFFCMCRTAASVLASAFSNSGEEGWKNVAWIQRLMFC